MAYDFPNAPTVGQLYPSPPVAGSPVYQWDGEKWVMQTSNFSGQPLQVAFTFGGKPLASTFVFVPASLIMVVPSGLVGTTAYFNTAATAAATFNLNKISSGTLSGLGTIVATAGSKTAFTLSGSGGTLIAGDVMQMVAPSTQDSTLADIGITIQVTRG